MTLSVVEPLDTDIVNSSSPDTQGQEREELEGNGQATTGRWRRQQVSFKHVTNVLCLSHVVGIPALHDSGTEVVVMQRLAIKEVIYCQACKAPRTEGTFSNILWLHGHYADECAKPS
jgi:hypothetical protein